MRPKKIANKQNDTIMVSVNKKERTVTFTTYWRDGKVCAKYRVWLTTEEVEYYDNDATVGDFAELLRHGGSSRID